MKRMMKARNETLEDEFSEDKDANEESSKDDSIPATDFT